MLLPRMNHEIEKQTFTLQPFYEMALLGLAICNTGNRETDKEFCFYPRNQLVFV